MTFPAEPSFYIVATLAIILVGLAKGGFAGLGAASMPMLVLVMDPIRAAALLLPILIVQDVVSIWAFRREFDMPTLLLTVPGAIIGVGLGWALAAIVPVDAVRGMVGLIALTFGAYRIAEARGLSLRSRGPLPQWLGVFWGGVSGFTSQIAHAGGPPFQVWALSRNFPHTVFIGTSAIFFGILNWIKVPAYWALGQVTWDNMKLTLIFLPVAVASTWAGVILVRRISAARFNTLINLLMILVGAELLRQATL